MAKLYLNIDEGVQSRIPTCRSETYSRTQEICLTYQLLWLARVLCIDLIQALAEARDFLSMDPDVTGLALLSTVHHYQSLASLEQVHSYLGLMQKFTWNPPEG